MSFFFAFSVAGFLGVLFALLAFRYARALCLYLLIFFSYFVLLPLASAWLYTGKLTPRALIGQDLYASDLADALAAHGHLFALYGLGVLGVGWLLGDATLAANVERTLRAQRFHIGWPLAFGAAVLSELLIRATYGILLSGTGGSRVAELPYLVTSMLFVLHAAVFGLFSYLAVLSARMRPLALLCLAYLPYVLVTAGRRAMLSALIAFLVLRGLQLGFKPNMRLALVALGALALFVLVGPLFIEARAIWAFLTQTGTPPTEALFEAVGQATDRFLAGESGFGMVAANVAERGNAGVFFLTVAERGVEPQFGQLTWTSMLWAVPSVFAEKPPFQVEAMIQSLASMQFIDDANSVPLVFYADFGALGMLLAGIYQALLLYAIAWLISRGRQFGLFEAVALGVFFTLSFSIENEFSGHFAELRNLALFAPLALLSRIFSGRQAAQAHARTRDGTRAAGTHRPSPRVRLTVAPRGVTPPMDGSRVALGRRAL
jgi:hypothetical protein